MNIMKNLNSHTHTTIIPRTLRIIISLLTLNLLSATAALAEDIEIYVGINDNIPTVQPNLVFIFDTSGSMNIDDIPVPALGSFYDAATIYPDQGCSLDRIYWREDSGANIPDCNTEQYFMATSNTCQASFNALGTSGPGFFVADKATRYSTSSYIKKWLRFSSQNHTSQVECKADRGVHGLNTTGNLYAANSDNSGPWRANDDKEINWNDTDVARTYTLFTGNYLNFRHGNEVGSNQPTHITRLEAVKNVFSSLIDSISNINLAVMRFDKDAGSSDETDGGYFIMPMAPLTNANRADYKAAVNATIASGYTPLAETLYESYLFYRGAAVDYGDSSEPGVNVRGVLDPDDTKLYKSPIEYKCQQNYTILLTDGVATKDTQADAKITGMTGFAAITGAASCTDNCLDELAHYAFEQDCSSLAGVQKVITHTIGFTTDQVLLNNTATKGGGSYYTADNTADLQDAFVSILSDIASTNTTFSAPAVSVNAFNRFNNRDELYYALFSPNVKPLWSGNIKRFRLAGDPPIIVDVNDSPAIDPTTGFFKSTATSFWTQVSDAPDGEVVETGGAAGELTLPRTIYTYTDAAAPVNASLSNITNALHEDNTAITKTMLGDASMDDAYRTSLLQWARGVDIFDDNADTVTTDIRRQMGDPLHAEPVLITYGGTDQNPDITLFVGTNDGQLNAINTTNGTEVFTFIPQELLGNLPILYENNGGVDHPYGLDGPLTTWVNDVNGNGVIYNTADILDSGEHAYLYQGMRRGGKNYYALDVTSRTSPTLKWVITGGSGDFSELGQTWSAATHGKIKIDGVDQNVLFFGGGYDPDQDDHTTATDDDEGRAIYIVNAETGAKLWQAGPAETGNDSAANPTLVMNGMTNSIPASLAVLDMNGDGYKDRIYAADTRGQIWRFDLDIEYNTSVNNLATGGLIAQLGQTATNGNTAAHNRRFYYEPDLSLSKDRKHLNIAIGSGFRAHPLNTTVQDAFYVIRDTNVFAPALDSDGIPVYTSISMINDLYDATANMIQEGTAAEQSYASTSLASSSGYYIWMNDETDNSFKGEKVLAKSLTFSNTIVFTTYIPPVDDPNSSLCSTSAGSGSTFVINLADGSPVKDNDLSGGSLTRSDRRVNLVKSGIPPGASIIFHKNGPVVLIGTEKGPDAALLLEPQKTYWREE